MADSALLCLVRAANFETLCAIADVRSRREPHTIELRVRMSHYAIHSARHHTSEEATCQTPATIPSLIE